MLHVYEFEVFKGQDGWLLAFPFDFDGGTQGADLAEVSAMAADWLKLEIEFRLMDGRDIPEATFGHEPTHEDGRILLVAVEASFDLSLIHIFMSVWRSYLGWMARRPPMMESVAP